MDKPETIREHLAQQQKIAQRSKWVAGAAAIAFMFLLRLVFHATTPTAYLYILGFFVLYGFVRYSLVRHLRCPTCKTWLSESVPPDYCPKCGQDFSQLYVENPIQ